MKSRNDSILLLESAGLIPESFIRQHRKAYVYNGKNSYAQSLPCDLLTNADRMESSYLAGKIINEVYNKSVNKKEALLLNVIMEDSRAFLVIKKSIIMRLEKLICSFLLADRFIKRLNIKEKIFLIPEKFPFSLYQFIMERKDIVPDNVSIPAWYLKRMQVLELKSRYVDNLKTILYPMYLLIRMRKMIGRRQKKKSYKYGIHIWNSWLESAAKPYRIDMVEGRECVNKSNTIYIVDDNISKDNLNKIKSNGFDVCIFREMIRNYWILNYIKNIFPILTKIAFRFVLNCRNNLCAEPYLTVLQGYAVWRIFNSKYSVNKFLSFQEPGTPTRSLCHKMSGAKSILIVWSTRVEYFYRQDMDSYAETYYGYLIYDALISSKITNACYRKNNNAIKEYVDCGVFFSDKVFEIRHNSVLKKSLKEALGVPSDKKVVGFCDTTMGKSAMLNIHEGSKLLDDVYHFLESEKECHVVYKNRGYGRLTEINVLRDKVDRLIAHERVSYVNKLMPEAFAYDIMGICDVVIVAFPTSAVLESAVGGVPAVCYIPSERFDKDDFVITKFPNFSARNYDELEKHCRYWLYQSSESNFLRFQDEYLKKYVDDYCDGRASNRLQFQLQNSFN